MFVKHRTLALAATALVSFAYPAAAAVEPVTGDVVLYWHEQILTVLAGNPLVTSRHAAMATVAIHDAVNASLGRPNYGYLGSLETAGGDTRAAAATAGHKVLLALYPARATDLNAALDASLALVPDGPAKAKGIATGTAMGAAVLARRAADGAATSVPYSATGLPGRWAPTPPGNVSPPAGTQWGAVTPWLLGSGDQFRAPAPPAITSPEYTAAYNEVKLIGAADAGVSDRNMDGDPDRSVDQSASAVFWANAPGVGPWIRAAIDESQGEGLSTLENASMLAQMIVSAADATIAIFDSKYYYDYWRPVTAIRAGDSDENVDTDPDPLWSSYITTPAHPSYISGHSGQASSAAGVLTDWFDGGDPFCLTWGGNMRCWDNFAAAAQDAADSRLWGGIHWSFDNQAGLDLGYQVAAYTLQSKAFGAVPEPASWALMIAGFGFVGLMARRRRTHFETA